MASDGEASLPFGEAGAQGAAADSPLVIPVRRWKYIRGLAPPMLVLAVLVGWLVYLLYSRAHWWQEADEANIREWVTEAIVFRKPVASLAREYLAQRDPLKAEEIGEQLRALGDPTRMYQSQLPLFPAIYRLEIRFPHDPDLAPIFWDSNLPRPFSPEPGESRPARSRGSIDSLEVSLGEGDDRAVLRVEYQLHAYNQRQRDEEQRQAWLLGVSALVGVAAALVAVWAYLFLKRERERELHRLQAQQQIEHAQRLALEYELRRRAAEQKQETAERQALELKSQLYASISIMAGSYAHNIKNLLVRPNDLLSRCLEADGLAGDQQHMLTEVRATLGTVTERLQQILRTVRRDPSKSEMARLDLNDLARDIQRTWEDLAREKWKMTLTADLASGPLEIDADLSHLMQAVENLLFNARDATFEMRNHLRDQARKDEKLDPQARRQALIDAAAWKGSVVLRTRRQGDRAILELQDNGIGMTDLVRRRCTETHFTTKRDNAVYEGNSTGMGLGLAFVVVILEHHGATLRIESEPLAGAVFRMEFPLPAEVTSPR